MFREGRPAGVGETITVAGYPLAGLLGSGVSITTGVVSNAAGPNNDVRLMQITAPVQQGNSGGPVLDSEGRVVGVVVSKLDAIALAQLTGDLPQNVNFAIKEVVAKTMLDTHGVSYRTHSEESATVSPTDAARDITIFIECK